MKQKFSWSHILEFAPPASAGFAAALGLLVITGWCLHSPLLIQIAPSFVPMQFNTALCFLLFGAGFMSLLAGRRVAALLAGGFITLIALLTFSEYLLGTGYSIDQLFMNSYITVKTPHPGRMAPNTSICFTLSGVFLFLAGRTSSGKRSNLATGVAGSIVAGFGMIALWGYLIGIPQAYTWVGMKAMAVHTAVGFMVIGFGITMHALQSGTSEWLPMITGVGGTFITLLLALAMRTREEALYSTSIRSTIDAIILLLVLAVFLLLALSLHFASKARRHAREISVYNKKLEDEISERKLVEGELAAAEARFRSLIENIPAITYIAALDDSNSTLYISPQVEDILGYSQVEWMADPDLWQTLLHSEDRARVLEEVNSCHKKVLPFDSEYRMTGKNGTVAWIHDKALIVRDPDGKPLFLHGFMEDITLSRKAENELLEQLHFHQVLIDAIPAWIYYKDTSGKFVGCNAAMAEFLGISKEKIIGSKVHDILSKESAIIHHAVDEILLHSPGTQTYESRARYVDGTWRDLIFYKATFRRKDCRLGGIVGVALDITERKKAEEALRRSEERLRAFFESDVVGTVFADIYGNIRDANDRFLDIVGYTSVDLRAGLIHWAALTPPEFTTLDDSLAAEAKKRGSCSPYEKQYIRKNGTRVWVLVGYILLGERREEEVAFILDISGHKQALEALQESQRVLSTLMGNLPGMAYRCRNDSNWTMEFVSDGCIGLTGYRPEEIQNNNRISYGEIIIPDDRASVWGEVQAALRDNRNYELNYRITTAGGELKWVWERGSGVYSADRELIALEGFISDVTEHKNLEKQLRHAQKMEAIGVLSGGIAHDFNNIINVIMGFASLMDSDAEKESPMCEYIQHILAAAERASNLTKSLLAFSRKQAMELRPMDLNDILHRMHKLLQILIREDIELEISASDENLSVMADAGQIEQVLVNLTTNAIDAMPHGGMLSISTMLVDLDREYINMHGYGKSGRYALLIFSDTGLGMNETTRQKIFEPFFTTKDVGKGTGLGLSIIYGIIKQHNGYINCWSEPDKGTTFKIYLPLIDKKAERAETTSELALPQPGVETILLAEDDAQLRELTKNVLEGYGYTVIEAADGENAVEKFTEHRERIHLCILDMIMPRKNGKEVYEEIVRIRPDGKVLFTSGYPEDIFNKDEILSRGLDFIAKPVVATDLLKKIRQVLDADGHWN